MKKLIFIFSISFFIFSCKKDKIKDISNLMNDCPEAYIDHSIPIDFEYFDTVYGSSEPNHWGDTMIRAVMLNPLNKYEIFFKMKTKSAVTYTLYKFDFCTNEVSVIDDDLGLGRFDISIDGWIIYKTIEGLFKIKINGGYKMFLPQPVSTSPTINGMNDVLAWSPNGKKIISHDGNSFNISDENGVLITALDLTGYKILGWKNDNEIFYVKNNNVYFFNIDTHISTVYLERNFTLYDWKAEIFTQENDSAVHYKKRSYYDKNGVLIDETPYFNKYNFLITGTPTFLNNNKIITSVYTQEYYPNPYEWGSLLIKERLAIMDLDGSNAREIKFPE